MSSRQRTALYPGPFKSCERVAFAQQETRRGVARPGHRIQDIPSGCAFRCSNAATEAVWRRALAGAGAEAISHSKSANCPPTSVLLVFTNEVSCKNICFVLKEIEKVGSFKRRASTSEWCCLRLHRNYVRTVLVQREMVSGRPSLASIQPFRGASLDGHRPM